MAKLSSKAKQLVSSMKDPDNMRTLGIDVKNFVSALFRIIVIVGTSYVILSPLIGMIVNAISSDADAYNPMVYILPHNPTLDRFKLVITRMEYFSTVSKDMVYTISLTLIQVFICSMVGYGFARFEFPFKKLLFGFVVLMIVIPSHTIMFPLYITFRQFDPLGICTAIFGSSQNLMGTPVPMYIMSVLGCGVRAGLYIYIFNQFFRGLPKEIEEAALVDGAGVWYTYFRIMLMNATPAVITVTVFSLVWQYNDTFFAKLFLISDKIVISKRIAGLQAQIANQDKVLEIVLQQLYLHAGIVLVILPLIIMYMILQKYFIEGVERSGIVG